MKCKILMSSLIVCSFSYTAAMQKVQDYPGSQSVILVHLKGTVVTDEEIPFNNSDIVNPSIHSIKEQHTDTPPIEAHSIATPPVQTDAQTEKAEIARSVAVLIETIEQNSLSSESESPSVADIIAGNIVQRQTIKEEIAGWTELTNLNCQTTTPEEMAGWRELTNLCKEDQKYHNSICMSSCIKQLIPSCCYVVVLSLLYRCYAYFTES